jgi:hypothetical protein
MSFRARVYLQLGHGNKVIYIGERDLGERPVRGSRVTIEHEGKMETFEVDMIVPGQREMSGIPTITVIPCRGE